MGQGCGQFGNTAPSQSVANSRRYCSAARPIFSATSGVGASTTKFVVRYPAPNDARTAASKAARTRRASMLTLPKRNWVLDPPTARTRPLRRLAEHLGTPSIGLASWQSRDHSADWIRPARIGSSGEANGGPRLTPALHTRPL